MSSLAPGHPARQGTPTGPWQQTHGLSPGQELLAEATPAARGSEAPLAAPVLSTRLCGPPGRRRGRSVVWRVRDVVGLVVWLAGGGVGGRREGSGGDAEGWQPAGVLLGLSLIGCEASLKAVGVGEKRGGRRRKERDPLSISPENREGTAVLWLADCLVGVLSAFPTQSPFSFKVVFPGGCRHSCTQVKKLRHRPGNHWY